ncbi:hypothetical protein GH5_04856 [Leishmania sp. Ghana 2012 LV757]|uniref:hypothetical protein n=1 Tax=Leishmania sp. Ghana 2012 LV757 TaxID=2803181 RepID=UPI001B679158|nr:hypothetical protein GH5_04856 [Leishmania sp. Ghana 2012 LV757]
MPLGPSPAELSFDASIHLSDAAFTSRVDYTDAYVIPAACTTATAATGVAPMPTAALVSPWLLVTPTADDADPSSSLSIAAAAARKTAPSPALETVPLAWRCPSCGTMEVEQLYWRRPWRVKATPTGDAAASDAAVAAVRAALVRSIRLISLAPALQARLERHRRRSERREEVDWRSLHISTRCRRCFQCPRCGGHGRAPSSGAAAIRDACPATTAAAPSSLSLTAATLLSGSHSVSALDIRLTSDMLYYAACVCCQWHSCQAFQTMEQLLTYMDAVMGDEKAEGLRERRDVQRSANTALRRGLAALLGVDPGVEVDVSPRQQQQTISQAAWSTFRHLRSFHVHDRSIRPPSHSPSQQQPDEGQQQQPGSIAANAFPHLHPALALEQQQNHERQRREAACAAPLFGVRQLAPQTIRVADLACEAAAQLQAAREGEVHERAPPNESPAAHRPTTPASITAGSPINDVEVSMIARTQQRYLGLPTETIDTRHQTLQTWMQHFQPAAVIAQERKAAAASPATLPIGPTPALEAPMKQIDEGSVPSGTATAGAARAGVAPTAAATSSTSALMHTPTSAYLHSVLSREQDRPLGLPAYYIPRVRKELLTALVWRLPQASAIENLSAAERACPCTRLVLLDRASFSDDEVRQVCQHWAAQRAAQIERHERKCRSESEQQTSAGGAAAAGKEGGDGDGNSDGGYELEDHGEGIGHLKSGNSHDSKHPAAPQHPLPQQRVQKRGSAVLPLPLFLDGTDFAALCCLPFLEYVRSGPVSGGGNACLCEWQFRFVNLNTAHDVLLTKLEVLWTVTAPPCTIDAQHVRTPSTPASAAAAGVTMRISSPLVPDVELPLALTPRCSPAERAAAVAAALPGGDCSHVADADLSPPLAIPSILTKGNTTQPIRLPELLITLRDESAAQARTPPSSMPAPPRCVGLQAEALTALLDADHARPRYHSVCFGLTVTLRP